jgi:rubrerythrin
MPRGDGHIDTAAREREEGTSDARQRLSSRRGFLSGSAKLLGGGALALGLGAAAPAFAKGNTDDDGGNKQQGGKANRRGVSDVDILNYALVLERLEYEFYRQNLRRFGVRQIEGASIFDGFGNRVRGRIYENLVRIREHEKTHVQTLIEVIKSLGGKPVGDSEYKFGVESVADFIATAQTLEDTGVMAYDGAIAYIDRPGLRQAGFADRLGDDRHRGGAPRLLPAAAKRGGALPRALRRAEGAQAGVRAGGSVHNQEPLRPEGVLRVSAQRGDHPLS